MNYALPWLVSGLGVLCIAFALFLRWLAPPPDPVGAADLAALHKLMAELAVAWHSERWELGAKLTEFSHKLDRMTEDQRLALVWGTARLESGPVTIAAEPVWCREGETARVTLHSAVTASYVVHVEAPFVLRRVYVGTSAQLYTGAAREVSCAECGPGILMTAEVEWPRRPS